MNWFIHRTDTHEDYKINDFKKLHNRWQKDYTKENNTKCTIEEDNRKTEKENVENINIEEEKFYEKEAEEILEYLNKNTDKNFKDKRYILPLLEKNKKKEDFFTIIDNKLEDMQNKHAPEASCNGPPA